MNLSYVIVEKLNVTRIFKVGDIITTELKMRFPTYSDNIYNDKLTLVIDKGVPDRSSINDFLKDLRRSIKKSIFN